MRRRPFVTLLALLVVAEALARGAPRNRTTHAGSGDDLCLSISGDRRTTSVWPAPKDEDRDDQFTFVVSADMREYSGPGVYDTAQFFTGACEAINVLGGSAFMISPGDIDPPADVEWTIKQYLGEGYLWYPGVGNHETETPEDMVWLRAYDYDPNGDPPPNIVNVGPLGCEETTYSFDYGNSHFVVLNEYCDGTSDTGTGGDVVDALYDWLVDDLNTTDKTHIFVFGHEPAYPQPDADNGRERHMADSLNQHPANRDRFWNLLREKQVVAYICGHTHNYSAVQIDGVWQLDAGHARGMGDTGARSTFILIHVNYGLITFEAHRDDANGGPYTSADSGVLTGTRVYLPLAMQRHSEAGLAVPAPASGTKLRNGSVSLLANRFSGAMIALQGARGTPVHDSFFDEASPGTSSRACHLK